MFLNKKSMVVTGISNKKHERKALQYVQITKKFVQAGDGFKAIKISNPDYKFDAEKNEKNEILIDSEFLKSTFDFFVKTDKNMCVPHLIVNNAGELTNDNREIKIKIPNVDEFVEYPDLNRLYEKKENSKSASMSLKHLEEMVKALKNFGDENVTVTISSELNSILFQTEERDAGKIVKNGQTFDGIIMPITLKETR